MSTLLKVWAFIITGVMLFSALCLIDGHEDLDRPEETENEFEGIESPLETPLSEPDKGETRGPGVPRVVLAEDFTNWGCGPCETHNPQWTAAIEAMGYNMVAPAYIHVHWPNGADPINNYGNMMSHADRRSSYYHVSGVPSPWIDGNYVPAQQTPMYYQMQFDAAAGIPATVSITTSGHIDTGMLQGTLNAHIECVDELLPGDYRLMIYIWENNITRFVPPNNEPELDWAVWLMLPDDLGLGIWQNGAGPGDYIEVSHTFDIEPSWVVDEVGATIFVQNLNNRSVEQAAVELFKSPAVSLTSPGRETADQKFSGTVNIDWTAKDTEDPDMSLDVDIEYSIDSGMSWNPIWSGKNNPPYLWDIVAVGVPDDANYLVRVTASDSDGNTGSGILSQSIEHFSIARNDDERWYLQVESTNLGSHLDLDMKPFERTIWDAVNQATGPPEVSADITGAGEFSIQTFASEFVAPVQREIAGEWNFSIHAKASASSPTIDGQLYAKVYGDNGVTSSLLFTTDYDDELVGSFTSLHEFSWTYVVPGGTTIEAGEHIVVEIMLHATAGISDQLYPNRYARCDIPVNGTMINSFIQTHASDDVDEMIFEVTKYDVIYIDEDFSSPTFPPLGWARSGPIYLPIDAWTQVLSHYAEGTFPEARFKFTPYVAQWTLYCGPIDTTGETSLDLEWDNYIRDYGLNSPDITCKIQTSNDGSSWLDTGWSWTSGSGNLGPGKETLTISNPHVGSSTFYFSFTLDGYGYDMYYWYVDNVVLGRTGTRTSALEHKWVIKVPTDDDSYEFYVEASRPDSADGDDFVFAYSTDDITYTDMVTVFFDIDVPYTYSLPTPLTETVYIRVRDTDRTWGATTISRIDIDEMYIDSTAPSRVILGLDHYDTPSYVEPAWQSVLAPPTDIWGTLNETNIQITWTLSPDDATKVDHYEIYRGTTYDPDGLGYVYIGQVPAGISYYNDTSAGDGNWNNYFYCVSAVDSGGSQTNSSTQAGKWVDQLSDPDWDMVSVPLTQSDTTWDVVLQTIDTNYHSVLSHDNNNKEWHQWNENKEAQGYPNTLTDITHEQALWVDVSTGDYLVTAGQVPESTQISLKKGWNYVGYPSMTPRAPGAPGFLPAECNMVFSWDAGSSAWEYYDPNLMSGTLASMDTGEGFWLHVTGDCTWTVDW